MLRALGRVALTNTSEYLAVELTSSYLQKYNVRVKPANSLASLEV